MTAGRIAATHRRFNGIRQVAPVCRPTPHLMHAFLGQPESKCQTASRFVQPFCRADYCDGNRTLRTQDTSVPRHFDTSAEVSRRHFGIVPKCPDSSAPRHFSTKTFRHQDISALVSGHFGTNAWTLRHYSRMPLRQCAGLQ